MQVISLAVVSLYIKESLRAVSPIVAQSIVLYYPSWLSKQNRNVSLISIISVISVISLISFLSLISFISLIINLEVPF